MNGTRQCVPSPTDFGNTPRKRSNINALLPPSTARRWSKRGRRGQAGFARRDARAARRGGRARIDASGSHGPGRSGGIALAETARRRLRVVRGEEHAPSYRTRCQSGTREAEATASAGQVLRQRIRRRLRSRRVRRISREIVWCRVRGRRRRQKHVTAFPRRGRISGWTKQMADFVWTLVNATVTAAGSTYSQSFVHRSEAPSCARAPPRAAPCRRAVSSSRAHPHPPPRWALASFSSRWTSSAQPRPASPPAQFLARVRNGGAAPPGVILRAALLPPEAPRGASTLRGRHGGAGCAERRAAARERDATSGAARQVPNCVDTAATKPRCSRPSSVQPTCSTPPIDMGEATSRPVLAVEVACRGTTPP